MLYTLGIFISVYVLLYFTLRSFIHSKILPIYKTIHKTYFTNSELKTNLKDSDIFTTVNREVTEWANGKTREIDQLKELAAYRKEFLGNVSHELKTPIFNIQGYISTLLEGGIEDHSINQKYLERSDRSINRLINIVNDLETIAQLESAEIAMEMENFDMIRLIEEVFEMYEVASKEANISLLIKHSVQTPVVVTANRKKIFDSRVLGPENIFSVIAF